MATQQAKGETLQALHEGKPFLIPNPWDAGSAKILAGLGFKALATTSAGFAFTLGRPDGSVTLDEVADHIRALDEATPLPVSTDLENGYGASPEEASLAITRAAEAGAVGGSIEDWDAELGFYEIEHATERVAAAAEAARALDFPFTFTARAENFVRDNPDLDDTIARLRAYQEAGADVLYAPRLESVGDVRAICEAVSIPVNVLAYPGLSWDSLVEAGAQRISVGGRLAFAAAEAMLDVAERLRDSGDFGELRGPTRIEAFLEG